MIVSYTLLALEWRENMLLPVKRRLAELGIL
jgi:hypothetical protein